jgi:hypothetical protein
MTCYITGTPQAKGTGSGVHTTLAQGIATECNSPSTKVSYWVITTSANHFAAIIVIHLISLFCFDGQIGLLEGKGILHDACCCDLIFKDVAHPFLYSVGSYLLCALVKTLSQLLFDLVEHMLNGFVHVRAVRGDYNPLVPGHAHVAEICMCLPLGIVIAEEGFQVSISPGDSSLLNYVFHIVLKLLDCGSLGNLGRLVLALQAAEQGEN